MAPGVDTKSETSCTANDITRQVDKHVFGKDVRRMSDHSPFGRKSTLLGISRALAVVLSRMNFRMRCPVLKVSLPEVYDKTAEINGFTVLQLLFELQTNLEDIRLCQTMHPWQKEYGLTSIHWLVNSAACQHVRPFSLCSCWILSKHALYSRIAAQNQLNCRGSNPHSRIITHHEGMVSFDSQHSF